MISKFEATFEKCSPRHGVCYPNINNLALKSIAGETKTVDLFQQDSVENYFRTCEGALFDLTDSPFWLSLTNSSSLVIAAPNDVNIPGEYRFWIGIWEVVLKIEAPCNANYLQGITEEGHIVLYIDDLVVLVVAFQGDVKNHSWEKACGSIQRVVIYDRPKFVSYNDHNRKITIKPVERGEKGLHIVLIELLIKSTKSFNVLEILVKLPATYIDSHLKPYFWPALEDEIKQYHEEWVDGLE